MNQASKQPIKRFPRLQKGDRAAAVSRMFWTEPEQPRVKVAKDGMSIKFVFKVRIPKEALDEPFRRDWIYYLAPPADRFERALQDSYGRTVSGKKPVHRHISNFLRRAFVKAFEVMLKDTWELNGYESKKEHQLEVFEKGAGIQKGPQPNSADAVQAVRLFEKNLKFVKYVRNKLVRKIPLETELPLETILKALRTLTSDPKARLGLTETIGPVQIARVMAEQEMPGVDFKKISFKKHVALGKKLLNKNLWDINRTSEPSL